MINLQTQVIFSATGQNNILGAFQQVRDHAIRTGQAVQNLRQPFAMFGTDLQRMEKGMMVVTSAMLKLQQAMTITPGGGNRGSVFWATWGAQGLMDLGAAAVNAGTKIIGLYAQATTASAKYKNQLAEIVALEQRYGTAGAMGAENRRTYRLAQEIGAPLDKVAEARFQLASAPIRGSLGDPSGSMGRTSIQSWSAKLALAGASEADQIAKAMVTGISGFQLDPRKDAGAYANLLYGLDRSGLLRPGAAGKAVSKIAPAAVSLSGSSSDPMKWVTESMSMWAFGTNMGMTESQSATATSRVFDMIYKSANPATNEGKAHREIFGTNWTPEMVPRMGMTTYFQKLSAGGFSPFQDSVSKPAARLMSGIIQGDRTTGAYGETAGLSYSDIVNNAGNTNDLASVSKFMGDQPQQQIQRLKTEWQQLLMQVTDGASRFVGPLTKIVETLKGIPGLTVFSNLAVGFAGLAVVGGTFLNTLGRMFNMFSRLSVAADGFIGQLTHAYGGKAAPLNMVNERVAQFRGKLNSQAWYGESGGISGGVGGGAVGGLLPMAPTGGKPGSPTSSASRWALAKVLPRLAQTDPATANILASHILSSMSDVDLRASKSRAIEGYEYSKVQSKGDMGRGLVREGELKTALQKAAQGPQHIRDILTADLAKVQKDIATAQGEYDRATSSISALNSRVPGKAPALPQRVGASVKGFVGGALGMLSSGALGAMTGTILLTTAITGVVSAFNQLRETSTYLKDTLAGLKLTPEQAADVKNNPERYAYPKFAANDKERFAWNASVESVMNFGAGTSKEDRVAKLTEVIRKSGWSMYEMVGNKDQAKVNLKAGLVEAGALPNDVPKELLDEVYSASNPKAWYKQGSFDPRAGAEYLIKRMEDLNASRQLKSGVLSTDLGADVTGRLGAYDSRIQAYREQASEQERGLEDLLGQNVPDKQKVDEATAALRETRSAIYALYGEMESLVDDVIKTKGGKASAEVQNQKKNYATLRADELRAMGSSAFIERQRRGYYEGRVAEEAGVLQQMKIRTATADLAGVDPRRSISDLEMMAAQQERILNLRIQEAKELHDAKGLATAISELEVNQLQTMQSKLEIARQIQQNDLDKSTSMLDIQKSYSEYLVAAGAPQGQVDSSRARERSLRGYVLKSMLENANAQPAGPIRDKMQLDYQRQRVMYAREELDIQNKQNESLSKFLLTLRETMVERAMVMRRGMPDFSDFMVGLKTSFAYMATMKDYLGNMRLNSNFMSGGLQPSLAASAGNYNAARQYMNVAPTFNIPVYAQSDAAQALDIINKTLVPQIQSAVSTSFGAMASTASAQAQYSTARQQPRYSAVPIAQAANTRDLRQIVNGGRPAIARPEGLVSPWGNLPRSNSVVGPGAANVSSLGVSTQSSPTQSTGRTHSVPGGSDLRATKEVSSSRGTSYGEEGIGY